MIATRIGTGWQTLMTDLSIVLFLITAGALAQQGPDAGVAAVAKPAQTPSQRSEPVAVYRAAPGAPPLGEWLASQPRDPRQMLTIVSTYAKGQQNAALDLATGLAREANGVGQVARVVVEPGEGEATATLAYDSNAVSAAADSGTPLAVQGRTDSKGDNR